MVRKTLSTIKSCPSKHRTIIDSMLKQNPWSSKQQSFAIFLIETYLPEINVYELTNEITKEEMLIDARAYTKEQVKVVDEIKNGNFTEFEVPLKTNLFDHQKKAYVIGMSLDSAAYLMEMGTGKTLAAIAVAGKRFMEGKIKRLLVVAPLSVLHVWESEFGKHALYNYDIKKQVLTTDFKGDSLEVFIVSYETSWRIGDEIMSWKPDMVIADESQRIKNTDSKRTQFLLDISRQVKYKLILTGTPVTQSPLDLFAQYKFLNPSIFGDGVTKFKDRYAEIDHFGRVIAYKNLDEMSDKAHSIAYRVRKDDVLDLPPFVDLTMYCELTESRKVYDEIKDSVKALFSKGNVNYNTALAQLQKLSQIAGGFLPRKEGSLPIGSEKMSLFKEIISDLPPEKKFVVFCRYLPEIDAISKLLTDMKIKNSVITGATKMSDRGVILDAFKTDTDLKCIVLNIQVGSVGIDLTAADTMIYYSHSYSYSDYEQSRSRIHRNGQVNKCTYIHLIAKDTIDERVMESLGEKKDVAQRIVDRVIEV